MKSTAMTLLIVFLVIAAGFGVGAATQAGVLILAAVPFALALILIMFWMPAKSELLAWAAFTVGLLGGTYLQTGEPVEYVVFFIYILLAALGIFKSPYFLALAWLIHPLWDFLPRNLPAQLLDLPLACELFDTPIGLYLLWGAWKKRWSVFGGGQGDNRTVLMLIGKALFAGLLMAGASSATVAAAGAGALLWIALPMAAVIILGFRWMGAGAEWLAWAVFTGWLGMTYAHTGSMLDALVFFLYVLLSALGYFKSPYFLAAAWLLFIPWGFAPHELTLMHPEFALACAIYCLPIGLYLAWAARAGRFPAAAALPVSTAS